MRGLLVSPYGLPELRCTPRMGSIEISPETLDGGMYLFTYTPFEGEPLYSASSVDLFTFERPTDEGSNELRVRARAATRWALRPPAGRGPFA